MIRSTLLALALLTEQSIAQPITIEGGTETGVETSNASSVPLPRRPWIEGQLPRQEDGAIQKRAFRLGGSTQTTLQLIAPIRDSLTLAGYEIVFTCDAQACGGFDFRFDLDLISAPMMHVDLGDYRYLLAEKPTPASDEARAISVVVSRDAEAGYVHVTEVFAEAIPASKSKTPSIAVSTPNGELAELLEIYGHATLTGLDFASGSAELGDESYPILTELAEWMLATPSAQIAIVGHTDAVGSLEGNTVLSRRRAESVLERLRSIYGIEAARMEANGIGYLAPVASNLTAEGRQANRRVEVIRLDVEPQ